jgi:hypothetical protein
LSFSICFDLIPFLLRPLASSFAPSLSSICRLTLSAIASSHATDLASTFYSAANAFRNPSASSAKCSTPCSTANRVDGSLSAKRWSFGITSSVALNCADHGASSDAARHGSSHASGRLQYTHSQAGEERHSFLSSVDKLRMALHNLLDALAMLNPDLFKLLRGDPPGSDVGRCLQPRKAPLSDDILEYDILFVAITTIVWLKQRLRLCGLDLTLRLQRGVGWTL